MTQLIPIIIFSLIFAYISDKRSVYEIDGFGEKKYIDKEKLFYGMMALGMAIFVGLRRRGNDTFAYRTMYESMANDLSAFNNIEWFKPATAPGLQFVCACLKNIGASTQDYFMLFALVTVCIYLWFIRKYTTNLWMSVYFFITMGVYTFTMAAIKQTVAVAFLLIATDRAIDRKYARFLFWLLIA
ncbi:MAG: EpsG family protein [Firmicutes bacterium]|nr:EpsG family protein [Bacillota bacterium]